MYEQSRVYLNTKRQVAIVTEEKGNNVIAVISDGSVRVAIMNKSKFYKEFSVPTEHSPAEAATTLLKGNRVNDPRAKIHLESISKKEYDMTDKKKAATAAATTAAPAPAPKGKGKGKGKAAATAPAGTAPATPAAPKVPKVPKAPKVDANGNPIPVVRKPKPPVVPYTLEQKLVTVAANPKRAGCAAFTRYALYAPGKTFTELLAAGLTRADFAYDLAHGFITAK